MLHGYELLGREILREISEDQQQNPLEDFLLLLSGFIQKEPFLLRFGKKN